MIRESLPMEVDCMSKKPRQRVSSGSPYEPRIGISRGVRAGRIIAIAGTAPIGPDRQTVAVGDAAAQARRCFEIVQAALEQLGASLSDVTRTRILLTRIEDWEAVALVHGEFFKAVRPANTGLQVVGFIDSAWLVDCAADAAIDERDTRP